jgi:hypothetical protein
MRYTTIAVETAAITCALCSTDYPAPEKTLYDPAPGSVITLERAGRVTYPFTFGIAGGASQVDIELAAHKLGWRKMQAPGERLKSICPTCIATVRRFAP